MKNALAKELKKKGEKGSSTASTGLLKSIARVKYGNKNPQTFKKYCKYSGASPNQGSKLRFTIVIQWAQSSMVSIRYPSWCCTHEDVCKPPFRQTHICTLHNLRKRRNAISECVTKIVGSHIPNRARGAYLPNQMHDREGIALDHGPRGPWFGLQRGHPPCSTLT